MEFASAKQAGAEKNVWNVTLAANSQARSTVTIRNQCRQPHSYTVTPRDAPYLQWPQAQSVQVPGQTNQKFPVGFNTAGMQPGNYRGALAVKCETCGEERGCTQENELIPVHLTITPVDTSTPAHTPTPAATPRYEQPTYQPPRYDVSPTPTPTATPRIPIDYGGPGGFIFEGGKITGYKINDKNCDGKLGDLELGLAGWTITVKNNATGATATAVTDATGFYSFNLPVGTYTISETPQSGWTQTMPGSPGTYVVSLTYGQVIRKDFLNCNKGKEVGKITGRKINDLNCNGKAESNEPGLAGWVITATNAGGGLPATAVTDANGFYSFTLPAGSYTISESPQTGWTQTMPAFPGFHLVTLTAGQVVQKDFANCKKTEEKECAVVVAGEATCKTDGSGGYTYTFTVTNTSGKDVHQILLTPAGGNLSLSKQTFDIALHQGESTTITVDIGNVKPEGKHCFYVTLMTKDGPCCTVEVCPTLPDCCATATGKFACDPRGGYTGTFTIVNTSPNTIKNIYLYPPAGVTMSQTYFAVTLAPGQSFTTPLIVITGAKAGRFCFRVSMHTADMKDCCSVEVCIVLPPECGVHPGN